MIKKIQKLRENKIKKKIFIYLILFLFISCIGLFFVDKWAKKHGFSSWWDLTATVSTNYYSSWGANYEIAEITLSENDLLKLEEQRDLHLKNGMITKINDRYVPAIISYKGKKIKCKLRLKGHMTDHLQRNKLSFRVKTISGDSFQGMKIFSLMHPGTRNYIYEWIYHKLLEEEGIATVRYSFIKIKVNGDDWGIYAVEENFANELVEHHKLPNGPILGFNPDLYWYARFNEHKKNNVDLENINLGASYAEAYDEEENFRDAEAKSDYAEASILLEKFRRGELRTSEVFDIIKLAKFHAILDLVGGQFSLDWSDVKYYYNPLTQKIEPVGYESFSVRNTNLLSGSSKYKNKPNSISEWHDLLFSDAEFFTLYVKELKRISKRKYLELFFEKYKKSIENNLATLYKEFPYKKLPLEGYYTNQKNIITLLSAPIMPAIYFNAKNGDSLEFTVACNSLLPLRLNSVQIGDKEIKLKQPIYLSTRKKNEPVFYENHKLFFNDTFTKKEYQKIKWNLSYVGLNNITKIRVKPINVTTSLNSDFIFTASNLNNYNFININETKKEIIISIGNHSINSDVVFPSGYKIIARSPLTINLNNSSRIISYSPIHFTGSEENSIVITSLDSTGKGIVLLNCNENSNFKFVEFINLGENIAKQESHDGVICAYKSPINVINCIFISEANVGIYNSNSKLVIKHSYFNNFKKRAIYAEYGNIDFNNLKIKNVKENGIFLKSIIGKINKLNIDKCKNAIVLENYSVISGSNWNIKNSINAVNVNDLSHLSIDKIDIENAKVGFHAQMKNEIYGPSIISVKRLRKKNINLLKETDINSKIKIN